MTLISENSEKTEKRRRGEHPRSLANLVTWQPGQTGNPGGRPKKKPITDRYLRIVETELPDEIRGALGLPRGATFGDAIALAQARQALRGDTAAAKETLVPEHRIERARSSVIADVAMLDLYHLPHGYWEAKDGQDDLARDVDRKLEKGYPATTSFLWRLCTVSIFSRKDGIAKSG